MGGEAESTTKQEHEDRSKLQLHLYIDTVDPPSLKLPTVDPLNTVGRTFLLECEVDGMIH